MTNPVPLTVTEAVAFLHEQGYKDDHDVVVVSPDVGGVARAKALAEMLNCSFAVIAKRRPEANKVETLEIVGDVSKKRCVLIDDMIDTGGSIVSGADSLIARGAAEVIATCTHPVFSGSASEKLQESLISRVICLDTIPITPEKSFSKLTVLPAAPLIGEAIRRIHLDESISELFSGWR